MMILLFLSDNRLPSSEIDSNRYYFPLQIDTLPNIIHLNTPIILLCLTIYYSSMDVSKFQVKLGYICFCSFVLNLCVLFVIVFCC